MIQILAGVALELTVEALEFRVVLVLRVHSLVLRSDI